MAEKPRDIPAFPQNIASDLRLPLDRMREAVQILLGTRGDGSYAAFTERRAAGLGVTAGVGGGVGPGWETDPDGPPDLTPPPSVEGLAVGAGIVYVFVEWDAATYTQGHGPGATNIYAVQKAVADASLPTFDDAELVYTAFNALTLAALPSEPNTRWHVWAKWVTKDGVESASPAGGVNGLTATTGQDVGQLLAILQGQITESELYGTLASRIDMIDGAAGMPGSVNARVAAETAARVAGDGANASAVTTLQASIGGAGRNLLLNSSFEVDSNNDGLANGWYPYNNSAGTEPHVTSRVAGRLSGYAQRIAWSGSNISTKGVVTQIAAVEAGIEGGVAGGWKPNSPYVISFWARSSGGAATLPMALYWNTPPTSQVELLNPPLSSTAWQRYAFRITTGAAVENLGRFYCSILNGAAATGFVDFDDVQVQEGVLLTGYVGDEGVLAASLQQEMSTRATETGALFAQFTVKLDLNGYVSGFGLASTTSGAAPTSSFIVRADRFAVASPTGPGITPIIPFVVTTTPTVENGVSVPAGVYMDGAYIKNLTAAVARLGSAWIDNAMVANLSAAKLTVGDGTVGGNLRSANHASASTGWLVRPDGFAEFNTLVARGTIYASAGAIGGITVGSNYLQSTTWINGSAGFRFNVDGTGQVGGIFLGIDNIRSSNYVGGASGFRIGADGSVEMQNALVRGNVTATSINAASGTLGTVTAGILRNSTDTTNMNLNATGSAMMFRAGAYNGTLGRYPVEIYANGAAYFSELTATSVAASGTLTGSWPLKTFTGEGAPPIGDVVVYIDTGINVTYNQFAERGLSARGFVTQGYVEAGGQAAGSYMLTIGCTFQPVLMNPLFAGSGTPNQSTNPWGFGQQRVYIRASMRPLHGEENFYYILANAMKWQLDWIA